MTEQRPLTIALVAGETSGDILGAGLIRALKEHVPNARFVGVAGPRMQAEGCEAWYEMEELAVMGIVEVLGRLRRLLHIRADLTKRFGELKPDVLLVLMRLTSILLLKVTSKAGYQNHSLRQSVSLGVATETCFQNRQSHRSGARISAFRKSVL